MAEVFVEFTHPVAAEDRYISRACGGPASDGLWHGWIEFVPVDGGDVLRSGRETTQPNRGDLMYWATGLTAVYLQGALNRALKPLVRPAAREIAPPVHDGPAPDITPAPAQESILNPLSVRKGERF